MSPDRGISRFRVKNPPPPCGEVEVAQRLRVEGSPEPSGGGTVEARAKALRKEMTPEERILWAALRELKPQGLHFRRQAPFDPYVLDFVCHRAKLVVEVDSSQHAEPENQRHDEMRTAFLKSRGYRVVRFWNGDVRKNRNEIVDAIFAAAKPSIENSDPTSPLRGGRRKARSASRRVGVSLATPPTRNRCAISTSPQGGGEG